MNYRSIKNTDIIDGMGIEQAANTLVLLIADPYPWMIQEQEHINALEKKIRNYVAYIQSGEYRSEFGDRNFDAFRIEIQSRYFMTKLCADMVVALRATLDDCITIKCMVKGVTA